MKQILAVSMIFLMLVTACDSALVDTSQNEIEDINGLNQFESKIANGVSLVFFHASWCSICAQQRPAFESVAGLTDYSAVFFGEVEFDDNQEINSAYGVGGFPTMVVYENGVEVERFSGKGHSKEVLKSTLDDYL